MYDDLLKEIITYSHLTYADKKRFDRGEIEPLVDELVVGAKKRLRFSGLTAIIHAIACGIICITGLPDDSFGWMPYLMITLFAFNGVFQLLQTVNQYVQVGKLETLAIVWKSLRVNPAAKEAQVIQEDSQVVATSLA